MGQIVKRKKKGRPAKADPGARELQHPERDVRRSLRRRNVKYVFDLDDYFDEDEVFVDDEDQGRREKKLKLLLKLQTDGEPESTIPQASRTRRVEHASATSASSSDDGDKPSKKRKIDDDVDEDMDMEMENGDANEEYNYNDEDEEDEVRETKPESIAEDSPPGTPAEGPSSLPLPDKRDLELILDKLQKKDIYGVYAEPVDPEELPDYHDVIKHPMDFATVRNKLRIGSYATFEEFESDVFLICSNAMQYNAPDTIYHKQARTIQELATKKFYKIRLNVKSMEKEIKTDQKMRSGSTLKKQMKRSVSRTVQEPVGSDFCSGATLATIGDIQNVTNVLQAASDKPGIIDGLVEGNSFLNENSLDKAEESLPGKGAVSRFGRKTFVHDENRRATYNISLSQPVASTESIFSTFDGETKQLVPVGLYSDHSYARSLARFAATLGSVAWKVASKRIEQALPQGFKFGQGWVGDYEPLPTPVLMLENCIVKEPPFLAKVQQPAGLRNFEKIPTTLVSAKESPGNVPPSEQKMPFLGPAGIRPPSSSIITDQPIRGNIPEMKPSFFLSPGIRPTDAHNISYQHQNLQSRAFIHSDRKVQKHVELNGQRSLHKNAADSSGNKLISKSSEMETSRSMEVSSKKINFSPSGSFKHPDGNGVASRELMEGEVVGNRVYGNKIASSSPDPVKPVSYNFHPHEQGQGPVQGLSDPVRLMRMMSEKAHNQKNHSNQSSTNAPQALPSAPSLSSNGWSTNNESNNAAVAAARAWMSVGAGGFRPIVENPDLNKNHQIYADSLYNSTRDIQSQVSKFRGQFPVHVQQDKSSSPLHAFVPQGPIPMIVGNDIQFQNQRMVYPQVATADLSRFQLHSNNWRNLSPQMHQRHKQESVPPDLNIGFQSSGSPSGVLLDSQQPDLALQL